MPCVSGRSNHILLKKDCKAGCACCVNTAYSCAPPCYKDQLINTDKTDIRSLMCELIQDAISAKGCDIGFDIELGALPAKHCMIRIEQRNVTRSDSVIAEIEDAVITLIDPIISVGSGDVIEYYVDDVLCASCTVP